MAVLKKIKFGDSTNNIQFTEVKPASGGVITATGAHTELTDVNNPEYVIDLTIADDDTLLKENGALKVGTVPAAQVSVADSDGVFTAENVETALKELKDDIAEIGGDAKSYRIVEVATPADTSLAEYKIQEQVGTDSWRDVTGSSTIVVPKDNAFVTAQLGHVGATVNQETGAITDGSGEEALLIEYVNGSGVYTVVAVPIGAFLKEAEFKDGLQVNDGEVSAKLGNGIEFGNEATGNKSLNVKIDAASESFLSVSADGVKISGVQNAIDTAIEALDVIDTAVAGKVVTAVSETDGNVSSAKADFAGITLGGFTQDASATGAIVSTDTLAAALNKLENAIDAAADDHTVVNHAQANTHVTVTGTENANGGMTYTVAETNIANADDLAGEITRAKSAETAIDSAVGLAKAASGETRTFTPTTNYGGAGTESAATSVMGNMQKLDTKLKEVADGLAAVQYKVTGTELVFFGMTEHA